MVTLGALIEWLESKPQHAVISVGFGEASSYRGDYRDVAFEPKSDATIGEMLRHAKDALDQTFEGYKGGFYTMHKDVECHIAEWGVSGDCKISSLVLKLWESQI
jgi:hypothetical protein